MKIKNTQDTSSNFYSNIDKIFKLINTSLDKEQVSNAEKYINYFFEVMIRFYRKNSTSSKTTTSITFSSEATNTVEARGADVKKTEPLFPDRNINNYFGDFFSDKIVRLLASNIKTGGFEVFYFVIGRLKDSIRVLLKEEQTHTEAALLLRQFKFIFDQIHVRQNNLSTYEQNWFISESYNWFIEFYAGNINTVEDIGLLENEIVQILKYYVDNERIDCSKPF